MPRKVFVAGEILTASDVNTNLMDQSVMVFDDATARTTAIPTPVAGMVTYLVDTDSVEKFDGTNFVPVIEAEPPTISQVVSTTKTDVFVLTSTTLIDVPDLAATITPTSSDSKVLVTVTALAGSSHPAGANSASLTVFRGASNLIPADSPGNRVPAFVAFSGPANAAHADSHVFSFLDSPETTSSTTYQVKGRVTGSTLVTINRGTNNADNTNNIRGVSTITLMEVAG